MFNGDAEVSWCFAVKDGETLLCLRVPASGAVAQLKQGDKVRLALAQPVAVAVQRPGVRTKLAALAGRWCRDPVFQQWLATTFPDDYSAERAEREGASELDHAVAVAIVRVVCAVESRAEFDSDARAGQRFDRLIRVPYNAWLNTRHPQTFAKEPA